MAPAISLPSAYRFLLAPSRYKVVCGGRAKAATRSIAAVLVLKAATEKHRILCTREIQRSIKNSSYKVLSDTIDRMGLGGFRMTQDGIYHSATGSEFLFLGLHSNREEIKGTEGITIAWVAESRATSQDSLDYLIPTVREEGSELWFDINPDQETDPVYHTFFGEGRPNAITKRLTYRDNPFFPDVLRAEMEWCKKTDYEKYRWIWEGECRQVSDALVFKSKFREDEFSLDGLGADGGPYYGVDWGFSVDPSTMVRCFVKDQTLYIDHEAYEVGADFDRLAVLFDEVPQSRLYTVKADSARPESIYEMNKRGFCFVSADKGRGSVEDGISLIRSFKEIVIHSRCTHTLDEFKSYSYKTDKLTGLPMPTVADKHNHVIDALRYSLEDVGKAGSIAFI